MKIDPCDSPMGFQGLKAFPAVHSPSKSRRTKSSKAVSQNSVFTTPTPGNERNFTYGVCLECNGEIFLIREKCGGKKGFPKGKQEDERPKECAFREFREETGIDLSKVKGLIPQGIVQTAPRSAIFRYAISEEVRNSLSVEMVSPEIISWEWAKVSDILTFESLEKLAFRKRYNFIFKKFIYKMRNRLRAA